MLKHPVYCGEYKQIRPYVNLLRAILKPKKHKRKSTKEVYHR